MGRAITAAVAALAAVAPLAAAAPSSLIGAGCVAQHDVALSLTLPDDMAPAEARVLDYELRLYVGGRCASASEIAVTAPRTDGSFYAQSFTKESARPIGELTPGDYGFAVLGRSDDCLPLIYGCTVARVGAGSSVAVVMARIPGADRPSPACGLARQCTGSRCFDGASTVDAGAGRDAGANDAATPPRDSGAEGGDGGRDGGRDGGSTISPRDAGRDAGPPPCNPSCLGKRCGERNDCGQPCVGSVRTAGGGDNDCRGGDCGCGDPAEYDADNNRWLCRDSGNCKLNCPYGLGCLEWLEMASDLAAGRGHRQACIDECMAGGSVCTTQWNCADIPP